MDAVQKVGNGHPGTAMSLAPVAYLLFQKVMRHNPADPHWPGRDRFVLSVRALLADALPPALPRWLGSRARRPQGAAHLGQQDPRPPRVRPHRRRRDHDRAAGPGRRQRGRHGDGRAPRARPARPQRRRSAPRRSTTTIYAICSDGDIQEGVSAEASSLAGTQKLGNLTVIYDDNQISIEDDTDIALSEDVAARYEAYGWHVQTVDWTNGGTGYHEDVPALHAALRRGRGGHRPAQLHRAPHDHRLARPQRAGHRRRARLRARRGGGGGHQEGARLRPRRRRFEVAARRDRAHPRRRRPRQAGAGGVGRQTSSTGRRSPRPTWRCSSGSRPARSPRAGTDALPTLRGRRQGRRDPQGVGRGDQRDRRRGARAVGRLGRPRRLQQHHDRGRAVVPAQGALQRDVRRATRTPVACCTSASASTRMGAILNGIALHGGTRVFGGTFLHVLRLHASRGAARRADAACR